MVLLASVIPKEDLSMKLPLVLYIFNAVERWSKIEWS